jgi:hypothetical protein
MYAGADRRLRRCRRAVAVNACGAPGSSHKTHMENEGSHQKNLWREHCPSTSAKRIIFPEDTVNPAARKVSRVIIRTVGKVPVTLQF